MKVKRSSYNRGVSLWDRLVYPLEYKEQQLSIESHKTPITLEFE